MPIDVEKILVELRLNMAQEIDEVLRDPWEKAWETYLLSAHDVVEHLKLLGFRVDNTIRHLEGQSAFIIIELFSPNGVLFHVTCSLDYPGVRFTCEESNPDDYEEDYYEDYEDYEEEMYKEEEAAQEKPK